MSDLAFSSSLRSHKVIYTLDAVAGFVPGLVLIFLHAPLAELIGAPHYAGFIAVIGAFLVPWGLYNYAIGTAGRPARSAMITNIIGDGLWVVLSQFNLLGLALLVAQALFVLLVFLIKLYGARSLHHG